MADKPDRKAIAEAMKQMDLCMMTTRGNDGTLTSRPMSNNAQVDWDGDNWFFSNGQTRKIGELEADKRVTLDFQDQDTWISLRGKAVLHTDKTKFEEHWTKDLDRWFEDGIDTPGLTLIQVSAETAEVWGKPGDGEISM